MLDMLFVLLVWLRVITYSKTIIYLFQNNKLLIVQLNILLLVAQVVVEMELWHISDKLDWNLKKIILGKAQQEFAKSLLMETINQNILMLNSMDAQKFKLDYIQALLQLQSMLRIGKLINQEFTMDAQAMKLIMIFFW